MSDNQANASSVFDTMDKFRGYSPASVKKDIGGKTFEDVNNIPDDSNEATSHTSRQDDTNVDMTPSSTEATSQSNENPYNNSQEEGQKVEETTTKDQSSQQEETYKKRYDDLKSHYDSKVNEYKEELSTLQQQISEMNEAVRTGKFEATRDINKFKENNPELFENMKSLIKTELKEYDKEVQSQYKSIEEKQQEIQHKSVEAEVAEVHPDMYKVKNSSEFTNWYNQQSTATQNLLKKGATAKDIIHGISLFKHDANWKSIKPADQVQKEYDDRQAKEAAASAVDTKSNANTGSELSSKGEKRTWLESEIKYLKAKDPAEFRKREKEIKQAILENRYKNDLLNK